MNQDSGNDERRTEPTRKAAPFLILLLFLVALVTAMAIVATTIG